MPDRNEDLEKLLGDDGDNEESNPTPGEPSQPVNPGGTQAPDPEPAEGTRVGPNEDPQTSESSAS